MNNKMTKGRLWQNRSGATLTQNIKAALDYYRGKYGDEIDAVMVPPLALLNEGMTQYEGVKLFESTTVPKGHLFLRLKDGAKVEEE